MRLAAGVQHRRRPNLTGTRYFYRCRASAVIAPWRRPCHGDARSRSFTDEPLRTPELSQLLWAAQGITREWGGRTAPSAGALYPLEVYVATPHGFYQYVPQGHKIELVIGDDRRTEIWKASLKQDAVRDAPAVFVITAVYQRTAAKYGDRAARYVHMEAGHAAQNLLVQAVALDLGGVPIGAFHDEQLQSALSLPGDHVPLYIIPVGHPAE